MHEDAVKIPLQSLYNGPYKVINKSNIEGKYKIKNIQILKPAFLESRLDSTNQDPTKTFSNRSKPAIRFATKSAKSSR